MTSGDFHAVLIDLIKVDRTNRQPQDLGDINELAEAIGRLGLINPITVTRDHELLAGERRLMACKRLGWDRIAVQYADEETPEKRFAIELEENAKRLNLVWDKQADAVTRFHEAKCAEDPDWNQEKTGACLGMAQTTVSEQIKVGVALRKDPGLRKMEGLVTTLRFVRRQEERAFQAMSGAMVKPSPKWVMVTDFNEWVKKYDGPQFNFIHCDFPYGIRADKMHQGVSVVEHGGYDDSPDVYWKLLDSFCNNLDRFCAKQAHLMFWFSMRHYERTFDILSQTDFLIDDFPLVWHKSDNKGLLPDPQRGPRRVYETALFGMRGERKIVAPVSNAVSLPTDSMTDHMSVKPVPVLTHFFGMFVDEYSTVLDPTCGSGTALRAANACGAAHVLGLEIDPEFAARAHASLAFEASRGEKYDDAPFDAA
jgi:ParB family chromosome partitioning protein